MSTKLVYQLRWPWALVIALLFLVAALSAPSVRAQAPDPRAILEEAAEAMGGEAPVDSEAIGTVQITAGATVDSGGVRICTLGLHQTKEEYSTAGRDEVIVFAGGNASQTRDGEHALLPVTLAVTSQSVAFPLVFVQSVLDRADATLEYVGSEWIDGASTHHVRVVGAYADDLDFPEIVDFTIKDIWVDSQTSLVAKVAYDRRARGGSAPKIPLEVFYADYQAVGGIQYPHEIRKIYNGTHWQAIEISQVLFNNGFTDADFAVGQEEGQ